MQYGTWGTEMEEWKTNLNSLTLLPFTFIHKQKNKTKQGQPWLVRAGRYDADCKVKEETGG